MKKLYFVSVDDYYVISVDEDGEIRLLEETNDNCYLFNEVYEAEGFESDRDSGKCKAAKAFLEAVEDDSSWRYIDPDDEEMMSTIEDMIHPNYFEADHPEVLAEIEIAE